MASPGFDQLNERMLERLLQVNPDVATILGKHDPYDRLLPHGGAKRLEDNLALLREWTEQAERISYDERLSRDQEISLEVLRMTLALQRFALEDYPIWRMHPDALEQPGWAIFTMMVRDYAPVEERVAGISSRIAQMPRYLSQFRERFNGSRAVRVWAESALEGCDSFPEFLTSVKKMFSGKVSSDLQKELETNCDRCLDAVRSHRVWLKEIVDNATDDFALG